MILGDTVLEEDVRIALSEHWELTFTKSETINTSCEVYENGEPFEGGCMY